MNSKAVMRGNNSLRNDRVSTNETMAASFIRGSKLNNGLMRQYRSISKVSIVPAGRHYACICAKWSMEKDKEEVIEPFARVRPRVILHSFAA
jgi:hypothetical protein